MLGNRRLPHSYDWPHSVLETGRTESEFDFVLVACSPKVDPASSVTDWLTGVPSYPPMNLSRCQALVAELERDPERVPAYYGELESAILWLMDLTFESKDPHEKTRLAATEMRARLPFAQIGNRHTFSWGRTASIGMA